MSDEDWSHMERTNSDYELIIGVSGVVFLEAGGNLYEVQAGDILIVKPGEKHRGYRLSSPGVSFYWFHFLIPAEEGEPDILIPHYARCPHPSRVHILARQLLHAANGGYRLKQAGDYFLTSLLIELGEQLQDTDISKSLDPKLSELLEWTRLHATDSDISAHRIAEHMGYNKNYLSRMFKQRFGTGLRDYIHRVRMEAAKELLVSSKLHIKEVAVQIGIEDDKQFVKWFKRLSGVTPTEYRQAFSATKLNRI